MHGWRRDAADCGVRSKVSDKPTYCCAFKFASASHCNSRSTAARSSPLRLRRKRTAGFGDSLNLADRPLETLSCRSNGSGSQIVYGVAETGAVLRVSANGARKRTRTSTTLRSPAPEAGASTNSAIRARGRRRQLGGGLMGVNCDRAVFRAFHCRTRAALPLSLTRGIALGHQGWLASDQPRHGKGT